MGTRLREPVNSLTHAAGAILAVIGLVLLIVRAISPLKPLHLAAFTIFGVALVALYLSSALYHGLRVGQEALQRMRRLDHAMIFVLIAATYTPVCLIALRGGWRWGILGAVWGIAAVGILFKLLWLHAPRWLSTALYLAMGWFSLIPLRPLAKAVPAGGMAWLAAGGVCYTVGAVIYGMKRPSLPAIGLGFHELFHLLCIGGSLSHFWMIYRYVAPMQG